MPIRHRAFVLPVLGVTQILAWGSSYYLPGVLAQPIAHETGWSFAWVVGGLSVGLICAGLISPHVGDLIQSRGGRPVLAASALLLAVGLLTLALSPTLVVFLLGWAIIGIGMGAGLYDAAFATLGGIYGQKARTPIGTLTLFGGFASTLCWPLSAMLLGHWGWRATCLTYAAIHLVIVLPLYWWLLPRQLPSSVPASLATSTRTRRASLVAPGQTSTLVLVASAITLSAMISTVMSVHLLTMLQVRGLALAQAVALGTLIGPTQVAARAIEMLISRYHHATWTMLAATLLVALGVGKLWGGPGWVAAALLLYGAGIGIESIARATVPLALFGHGNYAAIMGRIAMPSLIMQASAPSAGAILMQRFGVGVTLGTLSVAALLNVMLVVAVFAINKRRRPHAEQTAT